MQRLSLLPRLRQLRRYMHATPIRPCAPEFVPQTFDSPARVWPLDPRGEEIRTAKAGRLGINTSPRKLNLVAKFVRGLSIKEARRQLQGCKKKSAPVVMATIDAAVKNARAFGLDESRLIVREAYVGKGRYLKRLRPWHGKGRYGIEHKKYAHLTIVVRELDEELWEANVLPQYVHMRRGNTERDDDRNHPVHFSGRVSWVSDLDDSFRKTKEAVTGLRVALEGRPTEKRASR